MIEKILERLEEEALQAENDMGLSDTFAEAERCGGRWAAYEKAYKIVQEVAKEYGGGWIPFTQREMTADEKETFGTQCGHMLNCPLPEEDEEILVTYANGTVDLDIFMRDGSECYLDSNNDFVTEAIAWRKKPAPYQKGE